MRVSEFDDLFGHVLRWTRPEATRLVLVLSPTVEAASRDLARRESECCSFFDFGFASVDVNVVMSIGVPPEQIAVLDAIEARVTR
jgi:hypothetical protein